MNESGWLRRLALVGCVAASMLIPAAASRAEEPGKEAGQPSSLVVDYFANWFTRVAKTQAEQPHWVPPIGFTSPCLQQVFRYDIMRQSLRNGHTMWIYGCSKGVEFIPAERVQFGVGLPPWQTQDTKPAKEGWGDQSFLMKYRLLSANEQEGNYVLTLFGGVTIPNGSDNYTTHHYVFAPTLAFGKGWGDFAIQGTLGTCIPDNGAVGTGLGTPVLANVALQYHVAKYLWPEVEANYTSWPNGKNEGLNQLFIMPGLALGKFPIWRRLGVTVAAGYQIAVTDRPLYHHNFIVSARLPF
jgi:hypothetical protein